MDSSGKRTYGHLKRIFVCGTDEIVRFGELNKWRKYKLPTKPCLTLVSTGLLYGTWCFRNCVPTYMVDRVDSRHGTCDYYRETHEKKNSSSKSLKCINSMRETNERFESSNSCKRQGNSRLHSSYTTNVYGVAWKKSNSLDRLNPSKTHFPFLKHHLVPSKTFR